MIGYELFKFINVYKKFKKVQNGLKPFRRKYPRAPVVFLFM